MANKKINIDRGDSYVPTASQLTAEDVTYGWNFSREAARRGTTVSTAAWEKQSGSNVTISGSAISSGLATAKITSGDSGISIIRTTCTFADGTKSAKCLKLSVLEPDNSLSGTY